MPSPSAVQSATRMFPEHRDSVNANRINGESCNADAEFWLLIAIAPRIRNQLSKISMFSASAHHVLKILSHRHSHAHGCRQRVRVSEREAVAAGRTAGFRRIAG